MNRGIEILRVMGGAHDMRALPRVTAPSAGADPFASVAVATPGDDGLVCPLFAPQRTAGKAS
jgi:hypothetical protein